MPNHLAFSGLFSLCSLACALSVALAEEPLRGRLPDGRAFRTDGDGTQLVDYIAELEVNIESLNRRVLSLQDEVKDKDRVIQRISRGELQSAEIKEKDLVGKGDNDGLRRQSAVSRGEWACPKVDCGNALEASKVELEGVKEDLEIEKRLSSKRMEEHKATISQLKNSLEQKDSQLIALKDKVDTVEGDLQKTRVVMKIDSEQRLATERDKEQLTRNTSACNTSLSQLREKLAEKDVEVEGLKAKLEFAGSELLKTNVDADTEGYPTARAEKMARIKTEAMIGDPAGQTDRIQSQAVDAEKARLMAEIGDLKKQVALRNDIFAKRGQNTSSPVALAPTEAITKDRRTIGDLEKQLATIASGRQLSAVSRGIEEIRARVKDDIALVERMEKFGQP